MWIESVKNPQAFTEYSATIDDVYENLEDNNKPTEQRRVLLVFGEKKRRLFFLQTKTSLRLTTFNESLIIYKKTQNVRKNYVLEMKK